MTSSPDCQVVLLTPPGRGAIATVLVQGDSSLEKVSKWFCATSGKALKGIPLEKIVFGRWNIEGDQSPEELVVCRRSSSEIEVHCHGGPAVTQMILSSLICTGCQEISWQDWALRSYSDPIKAQARIALSEACTVRSASILLDQHRGALSQSLQEALDLLNQNEQKSAEEKLQKIAQFGLLGTHLIIPWKVVLAGEPNVGKSSLINKLLGFERAIVFDRPGTTRDVVTAKTAIDGWPVELMDTAGLRDSDEEIELAGIAQTRTTLAHADLILFVLDARKPWSEENQNFESMAETLLVFNKSDLVEKTRLDDLPGLTVSAQTGEGLPSLLASISKKLVPFVPSAGSAVPFTDEQIETIERVVALLREQRKDEAVSNLSKLIGASC